MQKTMGVMHGSRMEERKYRKVTFRIRGNQHVEVVAVVKAATGRIPSNVCIGLREVPFAVTVIDSL
jgi:hypothetical protein